MLTEFQLKIISNHENQLKTYQRKDFIVTLGILLLKPFKRALTLLVYLQFQGLNAVFILQIFHQKSFQSATTQKLTYRKLFSWSFSEFSRQDLSNEPQLYGFILILRDFTTFAKKSLKIVSKGDNSKATIPETVFKAIFGILASRAFKRAPTLWVYLHFEIFYIFFKISDI